MHCSQSEAPLNNYQYPLIQTYTDDSPESVYLGAQYNCPAFYISAENYEFTEKAHTMAIDSADFYQKVGSALLGGVLEEGNWNSYYAAWIYDYANYMNNHDSTSATFLSQRTSDGITNLQQLMLYSDQQLLGHYGKYMYCPLYIVLRVHA